jgi:hypothetical protein
LIGVYTTAQVDSIIGGIEGLTSADIDTLAEINAILTDADLASVSYVDNGLSGKQATLVSGTNIKTVNSTSLLGSGDITVSASPGGSSGQVQYNNSGAFGGMTAVVYAGTGTHVTVTAQGSTVVPICVKGAASHSVAYVECRTSADALLVSLEPIVSNAYGRIRIRSTSADVLNLSCFSTDAYIDCNTGDIIFRTAGSVRTNLTLHNSTTRVATFGGAVVIGSSTDAAAANSTLYYSTTQSKLVWKDAGGVVNNLY